MHAEVACAPSTGCASAERVRPAMSRDTAVWRSTGAALAATLLVAAHRRVLGTPQRSCWPPPDDAVTSAGASAATAALGSRGGTRPHGTALDFAWSTAATIEPWVEGVHFFPRIFADVEAASSSVHILMFGWREGEVGMRMAALLEEKLAAGVEVRVIVDGFGSKPYEQAREMFSRLAAAGAEIVVNDMFPLDRDGVFPTTSASTGAKTSSVARTIASSTSSTDRSHGRAERASKITSTTAAST